MAILPDYLSRIQKLVTAHENTPFQWGKHDCAIWGSKVVECITGEAMHSSYVGRYKTRLGGMRIFKAETGYSSHIAFIEASFKEVPVSLSQDGDLGIVDTDEGPAVVVCLGSFAAGIGPSGLIRFPISEVKRAFRVTGG